MSKSKAGMRKMTGEDPLSSSVDLIAENIQTLKKLFPEIVTEGRIDFDVLKQLAGGEIDDAVEKYGLNWHGKRNARQLALVPSTGTLRPCPEESIDWDTTRNLFIEGDNLEVLKLLQKSYAGKVKLIYIDPPYNTGKDFVYPDDFQDNIKNYLDITGQTEGGRRISSNTEVSGRFHTAWLNMMYPRLRLARELLCNEGSIFVSCNDSELSRLTLLLEEIFGSENYIATIVWQRSKKGDSKLIATIHEYIISVAKDKHSIIEQQKKWRRPKLGADEVLAVYDDIRARLKADHLAIHNEMVAWFKGLPKDDPRLAHKHYNWSDERGLYFAADFAGPDDGRASRPRHDILHPVTRKPCKKPSTGWRWDEAKTQWALSEVPMRIHFGPDETTIPNRKSYLREVDSETFSSVFYRDGRSATLEVEALVGKGEFQFPKNREVLEDLIALTTSGGDVVMDFFGGSGSTGHAIMSMNASGKYDRRFIIVQLPEPVFSSKYQTISEISIERLQRASLVLRKEHQNSHGDLGFRVFKLDSSNIREWDPQPDDLESSLFDSLEHIKSDRSEDDLLYEVLLKLGLDLCVPIETRKIASTQVHAVGGGVLFTCLAGCITRKQVEALATGLAQWHAELNPIGEVTCVFRDNAFEDDVAKSNLAAILNQQGIHNVRSL